MWTLTRQAQARQFLDMSCNSYGVMSWYLAQTVPPAMCLEEQSTWRRKRSAMLDQRSRYRSLDKLWPVSPRNKWNIVDLWGMLHNNGREQPILLSTMSCNFRGSFLCAALWPHTNRKQCCLLPKLEARTMSNGVLDRGWYEGNVGVRPLIY